MGNPPVIRRMTLRIPFTPGGTIDYKFTDRASPFIYLGSPVQTVFNEITLVNFTNGDIFYSLESDVDDSITVDGTATEGVMVIERKSVSEEVNSDIARLRITAVSTGDVYAIIYNNNRTSYR